MDTGEVHTSPVVIGSAELKQQKPVSAQKDLQTHGNVAGDSSR